MTSFRCYRICSAHQTSADLDEQPASVIKLEHVKRFFESVRDLMLENAMLELGNCLLTTISLPSLTIKANKVPIGLDQKNDII